MLLRVLTSIIVAAGFPAPAHANPPGDAGQKVLIILPHPDDEVMMRATLMRMIEKGHEVSLVVMTLGEGGKDWRWADQRPSWELTDAERASRAQLLAETRRREMKAAIEAYGIHHYYQLEIPDDPVRDPVTHKPTRDHSIFLKKDGPWNPAEIKTDLAKIAETVEPDLVITFYPGQADSHAHHQATAKIVTDLENEGRLGKRLKGIYGFYEDHVVKGIQNGTLPGELAGTRIEFSPKAKSPATGRNAGVAYGELGTKGALMHESQKSGLTAELLENWDRNPNEIFAPMGKQKDLPSLYHLIEGVNGLEAYRNGATAFIPPLECYPDFFLKK